MTSVSHSIRLLVGATLLLAGCATQRAEPVTPEITLPAQFRIAAAASAASKEAGWWQSLGDPELDRLVARALAENPDVAIAQARIEAARAGLRHARSGSLPQVALGASSSREQLSGKGLFGSAIDSGAFPEEYSLHRAGIDASWENDVFGAQRARRRAARVGADLADAERATIQLSLPAEVARVYIEHLVVSQQVQSVQRSLRSGEGQLMLLGERRDHGDVSEHAVMAARLRLDALHAVLPRLEAQRESLRHAMGALIGTGEYVELPESGAMLDQAAMLLDEAVPTGAPSDLLRRRPDLLGAEARFREAFAEHQYAIADQYPRFSLSGSAGTEALHGGDLLSSASFAWSFVQQLAVPLFDGGRRRAVRAQKKADLDAAVAAYRRDVVIALTDVEQSLLSRQATRRALRIQESRLQQAQRQLEVEQARHAAGDSTVGDLLASEQVFEAALQDVLSARGMALGDYVRLHKALGGPA